MSAAASPFDVLAEEARWDHIVAEVLTPDAELVAVSRWVPDSRAYVAGDRVALVRLSRVDQHHTLARAVDIRAVLDLETEYVRGDDWEALVVPLIDGATLESLIPRIGRRERLRLLIKTVPEIRRIHRQGVAHCDLRPDNVLVTRSGDIRLVDFDRALQTTPRRAAVADWLGFGAPGPSPKPYWKLFLLTLEPRTRSLVLRARRLLRSREARPTPEDGTLRLLEQAWALAASSGANAPGHHVAYYAFTLNGWHLPGERAWYQRWEPIRHRVDFRDKRVLELGCNMGLFSSFAALHGAREAIGVDHSELVLDAARLVARALGAQARFERVDLLADPDWERRLGRADIVAAMSLVHWLPSPDRVLRFLAGHSEVIYEGHDSLSIEEDRLRRLGFTRIEVLCTTERGREVLYACR
jgi:hypothetical protein